MVLLHALNSNQLFWKQKLRVLQLRLSQLRVQGSAHSLLNLLSDGSLCLQSSQTLCTPGDPSVSEGVLFWFRKHSSVVLMSHCACVKGAFMVKWQCFKAFTTGRVRRTSGTASDCGSNNWKRPGHAVGSLYFQVQNLAQSFGQLPIENIVKLS